MCFFLHDMEELFNRGGDGNNGNSVKAIPDTKTIFVNFVYWDRTITHTLKCSLLKGPFESTEEEQIESN